MARTPNHPHFILQWFMVIRNWLWQEHSIRNFLKSQSSIKGNIPLSAAHPGLFGISFFLSCEKKNSKCLKDIEKKISILTHQTIPNNYLSQNQNWMFYSDLLSPVIEILPIISPNYNYFFKRGMPVTLRQYKACFSLESFFVISPTFNTHL